MLEKIVNGLRRFPWAYGAARSVYRGVRDSQQQKQRRREQAIADAYHGLFYDGPEGEAGLWNTITWRGVPMQKCPFDLLVYQEILHETRPELIIECGLNYGGSTMYLATLLDALGHGEILGCDISLERVHDPVREHPRVELIESSSTADPFLSRARERAQGKRTMVILDSDHSKRHVLDELRLHAPLVTPGCYLFCEDTNINGHPVHPEFGPGPYEALEEYLREAGDLWTVDRRRERFLVTFNPNGYLRRNDA